MEEEMQIEPVFEVQEIDLDYEFDAPRFFDFVCDETLVEARQAELWFQSAPSYPPSPFVAELVLREDVFQENVSTSPKCEEEGTAILVDNESDYTVVPEYSAKDVLNGDNERTHRGIFTSIQMVLQKALSQPLQLTAGFTLYEEASSENPKGKDKTGKPFFSRSSTLMKPTASQLAKQNQRTHVDGSRFQKLTSQNNGGSLCNSSLVESQAAKRQKLDGGVLHKVGDVKQQTHLVHKTPKREVTVDRNSMHTKLKLTIPREPELETAHRAQRTRPRSGTEQEHDTSTVHRFKARPLNRKILEAPSLPFRNKTIPKLPEFQEFHLKTTERAVQHSSSVSSSALQNSDPNKVAEKTSTSSGTDNASRELRRPNAIDATRQDGSDIKYSFKARPLNKKIFSSKGDVGVFRSCKRETTVPMEFNFHTEKRVQQNLPIELFSKLSLTSELQQNDGSQSKFPPTICVSKKGSKENRLTSFQPKHEIKDLARKTPSHLFSGRPIQCGVDDQLRMRSLGIR